MINIPFFDTTVDFNVLEAMWWFALGGCLLTLTWWVLPHRYQRWAIFSAVNLILFGVTDVGEVYTGGFLHTAPWLLWWKVVHVGGLVVSLVWYLRLRQ